MEHDSLFLYMLGHMHKKKRERVHLDLNLIPYAKINPNPIWFVNLNVQHKPIKFIEGNIGKNLYDLELGRDFRHDIKSIIHERNN